MASVPRWNSAILSMGTAASNLAPLQSMRVSGGNSSRIRHRFSSWAAVSATTASSSSPASTASPRNRVTVSSTGALPLNRASRYQSAAVGIGRATPSSATAAATPISGTSSKAVSPPWSIAHARP